MFANNCNSVLVKSLTFSVSGLYTLKKIRGLASSLYKTVVN
jgi:hypothetical protein